MMVTRNHKSEEGHQEETREQVKRRSSSLSITSNSSNTVSTGNLPGPFKHMTNPYTDMDGSEKLRGNWATHPSQLPPLRGIPRRRDSSPTMSRNSPRPSSRNSLLGKPVADSPTPKESPGLADHRRKSSTKLIRRESRPGTAVNRPLNFPPALPAGGAFSLYYVDISPSGLRASVDLSSSLRYERFQVLVGKANAWLAANPEVFVINCETIETRSDEEDAPVDTSQSSSYDDGELPMFHYRSIRLWIRTRQSTDPRGPHSINYINIVPQCFNPDGFTYMESPEFESLDNAISNFNTNITNSPLKGKIVNIETVNVKFTWGKNRPDPDRCQWEEEGHRSTYTLVTLRVFFRDRIRSAKETIGLIDFVPNQVKPATDSFPAVHESMEQTINRVNQWLSTAEGITFCSVQTVEYKPEENWDGQKLDTTKTYFRETTSACSRYLRLVRVFYTIGSKRKRRIYLPGDECELPIFLSYRTFQPEKHQDTFDCQKKTLKQATNWVQMTDAKIACCETLPVRMNKENAGSGDPEVTFTQKTNSNGDHLKYTLRIFLEGYYSNPATLKNNKNVKKQNKSRSCIIL